MQRRIFFTLVLLMAFVALSAGCAKKEEAPQPPASAPQTTAPSPTAAAPAPAVPPVPAETTAAPQKDVALEAHKDFEAAFTAAMGRGNDRDALQARIQAVENAKDACMKLRGELDDPADIYYLNKFIDSLQEYSDKGHAYAAALEDADRLYAEIKKGHDSLKDVPQKDQAQAVTRINEKTIRYNDLFKNTLPRQRDELESLGKDLLAMKKQ